MIRVRAFLYPHLQASLLERYKQTRAYKARVKEKHRFGEKKINMPDSLHNLKKTFIYKLIYG